MNYYKKELDNLKNTEYYKSIIITDNSGQKTKNLDINLESIPEFIKFLKKEEKRLKKGGKNE